MLKALMQRKACALGRKEWQMDWTNPEQKLFNLGFQLAAVLEQADLGTYDAAVCNKLFYAMEEMHRELNQEVMIVNLLACQILLGFVAIFLGLPWTIKCPAYADRMWPMVQRAINNGEADRCIFPLTCLSWQYRADYTKMEKVADMMKQVADIRKVRFASKNYQAKSLVPKIASGEAE